MAAENIELLVCKSCRAGQNDGENVERAGAVLMRRLRERVPKSVHLTEVECLSNCSQGCTIALSGPGQFFCVAHNWSCF